MTTTNHCFFLSSPSSSLSLSLPFFPQHSHFPEAQYVRGRASPLLLHFLKGSLPTFFFRLRLYLSCTA